MPTFGCKCKLLNFGFGMLFCLTICLKIGDTILPNSGFGRYCISRNFHEKIFSRIWLKQTFCEFLFSRLYKGSLHIIESVGPMSKLTIVTKHQSLAHFSA